MFKFNLGDKVKDWVSGCTGVICCRTEWLNGCLRYGLQAAIGKDGKLPDFETVDEGQLVLVSERKAPVEKKPTGGPQKDPNKDFCLTKRR